MKFMVEFRLRPGSKHKVVEAFELLGPNRRPGVSLRSGWIGMRSDVIFVLVEAENEDLVNQASQTWKEHGVTLIHPVIDAEQY